MLHASKIMLINNTVSYLRRVQLDLTSIDHVPNFRTFCLFTKILWFRLTPLLNFQAIFSENIILFHIHYWGKIFSNNTVRNTKRTWKRYYCFIECCKWKQHGKNLMVFFWLYCLYELKSQAAELKCDTNSICLYYWKCSIKFALV